MVRIFLLISFSIFTSGVWAQQTFTERLTEDVDGQGTVSVFQSEEITRMVNGETVDIPFGEPKINGDQGLSDESGTGTNVNASVRKMKIAGYRIQVYAGGNSRASRDQAKEMAIKVKEKYADLSVYTSFQSPRWLCRVGDFRTIEEADSMLRKMREANDFEEASIVKSYIQISY